MQMRNVELKSAALLSWRKNASVTRQRCCNGMRKRKRPEEWQCTPRKRRNVQLTTGCLLALGQPLG